jgi:hypothetical protein
MSELRKLEDLEAHAQRAADDGLDPATEMQKYEPTLHCIWLTEYHKRMGVNVREAA